MKHIFNYNNGITIKVWLDELPDCVCADIDVLCKCYKSTQISVDKLKEIAVELKIPSHISNYCMLGVRFTNNSSKAEITIHINDYNEEVYYDNIGIKPDVIHKGIPKEYVLGIVKSLDKNDKCGLLKQGNYDFIVGAHAEVGSSVSIFYKTSNVLLQILQKSYIDKKIIGDIIQREFEQDSR